MLTIIGRVASSEPSHQTRQKSSPGHPRGDACAHPALDGATMATSHHKVARKGSAKRTQEAELSQQPTKSRFGYRRPWHPPSTTRGVPNQPRITSARTMAISGSRPWASHTAGFYRESAALPGSDYSQLITPSAFLLEAQSDDCPPDPQNGRLVASTGRNASCEKQQGGDHTPY